jgi:CBS domain containing-hemolysin-like protein
MSLWMRATSPFVWLLDLVTLAMLRLFGAGSQTAPGVLDTAELRTAIRLGAEAGALEELESSRLLGALTLAQRQVQEIMTPRVNFVTVDANESLRDVAAKLAEFGFLRLPVYDDNPDNIVGYVHVSDVNQAHLRGIEERRARDVMRPVQFESEHSTIAHVLELMKRNGAYLVMLVDEYGSTSGLVTLEDIVEEVVGTLRSESGEEQVAELPKPGGRIEVEGSRLLVDLSNQVGVDLTEVDANTVAGLVLSYTHRFPERGETVEHTGFRFTVVDRDERRIRRVAVEPIGADHGDADDDES